MSVRWLLRRDTRHTRWLILRIRLRALRYGDDWAETFLALDATLYALVLLAPGRTMVGPSWRVIGQIPGGDVGLATIFGVLAAALWLATLRLVPCRVQQATLVATLAVWVGMAVGFFVAFPLSIDPWVSLLIALTAWMAYLRTDA